MVPATAAHCAVQTPNTARHCATFYQQAFISPAAGVTTRFQKNLMPLSRTRTNTGSHLRLLPLALAFLACILAVHAKFTSFTLSSPASQQCQQCIARLTTAPSNLPHAAATIACARLGAVGLECAEEAASELFAIETTLRVQSLGRQYSSHIVDVSQRASLEMFPRFMYSTVDHSFTTNSSCPRIPHR